MKIPTALEINPYDDLDGRTALKNFLGKSFQDATEMFMQNSYSLSEDLMWMGIKAFAFYLPAVIPYLESDESQYDCFTASSLISTFRFRLEHEPETIQIAGNPMISVLRVIQRNFPKYDADQTAYPNLQIELQKLIEQIEGRL